MKNTANHTSASGPGRSARNIAGVIAAAAILAGPLLVLPSAQAAEAGSGDHILKVATSADIDSLNPFLASLASSTNILALNYERLVEFSAEDNSIVPGMASKWTTSSDGLTWDFTIPEGRTWSDGEPVTANDAAFTFSAIMTNEKLQQANGGLITNVKSAVATDDNTLEITLNSAQAPNPGADLPIVPEHVWSKVDDPATFVNDADVVGSGPFTITSYTEGQSVQLAANKHFWRGKPKIDGINFVYYKNLDAQVQGLKTGEVDIVRDLTPAQYDALKSAPGITRNAGDGRRYTALAINPGAKDATGAPLGDGNPALQDVKLRTAIVMAVDKKTLLAKVKQGLGTLGETEIPPVYPAFFGVDKKDVIPFDPAAANTMLDDAGYAMGPNGLRLDKQGKPLELRLLGRSSDPSHAQIAEYVGPWLKDIGIGVSVTMKSDNQVNDDSTLGKYDMYFTGWGLGPDPDFQLSINTCSSYPNADGSGSLSESNWCDPEFDSLFAAQHAELDLDKRADLVKQAMTVIYKAAANDVLYYANTLEAYRSDRFASFATQPSKGGVITGQNGYWGYYSATPTQSSSADAGDSGPSGLLIGGIIVVIIAGLAAVLIIRRRGATADDRE